jgi:hypothetical protein
LGRLPISWGQVDEGRGAGAHCIGAIRDKGQLTENRLIAFIALQNKHF